MIQYIHFFLYTVLYTHLLWFACNHCNHIASHFSATVACQDSFGMVDSTCFSVFFEALLVAPVWQFHIDLKIWLLQPFSYRFSNNVNLFKGSKMIKQTSLLHKDTFNVHDLMPKYNTTKTKGDDFFFPMFFVSFGHLHSDIFKWQRGSLKPEDQ